MEFTRDDASVVIADKSGDVFQYSTTEEGGEGRLLLGHVSMVLDAVSGRRSFVSGRDPPWIIIGNR